MLGSAWPGALKVSLRSAGLLALGIVLVAAGCPPKAERTLPAITSDNPAAEASLRQADAAAEAGQLDVAEDHYRTFLRNFPTDPLVAVAHLGLGRVLLAKGSAAQARVEFSALVDHPDPALAERARLYEAVAMHLQGDSAGAAERLASITGHTTDPTDTALLYQTLAAAAERLGHRIDAVLAYDALIRSEAPAEAKDEARGRVDELIAALEPAEVDELFDRLPRDGHAWPNVGRRALREAFARGDLARVRSVAVALESANVPLDRDLQSIALRAERTGQTNLSAVGAILPLTGRGQEVGQAALQALMLAAGLPLDAPPHPQTPRVFFRDSRGEAERAARAVDDLVTLHQVVAIVGPVDTRAARAAARRAQELGVPILTLSPDRDVVGEGDFVFRLFPSPQDEAEALVDHAFARGARRFAALRPDHGYGAALTRAVREAVERQGGEWVGEARYAPGTTSFRQPLEELASKRFDALLLPDHARQVALVAPALAASGYWSSGPSTPPPPADARPIQLLIPSVGLDDSLVRNAGRYLQGAAFAGSFLAASAHGRGRRFAEAFRERYRRTPDAYAAAAYDAFRLVRAAIAAGARSRAEVAQRLVTGGEVETAGASRGFDSHRQPQRGAQVWVLDGASLVSAAVSGATATPPRPQ